MNLFKIFDRKKKYDEKFELPKFEPLENIVDNEKIKSRKELEEIKIKYNIQCDKTGYFIKLK